MWSNPQFSADLFTFSEEILNGKVHFLFSDFSEIQADKLMMLKPYISCKHGMNIKKWNNTNFHRSLCHQNLRTIYEFVPR